MKLGKKRARTDGGSDGPISFIYKDLDSVQLHHNDALVITLRMGDYDVEKILADQGS